jgi:hypothetical protein
MMPLAGHTLRGARDGIVKSAKGMAKLAPAVRGCTPGCLSFCDVQDLTLECGVEVSHEAIRLWTFKFGAEYSSTRLV